MKSTSLSSLSVTTVFLALSLAPQAQAGVFVEVFENYVDTGSSVTFSNLVGTFETSMVDFVIGTGASWHPFGLSSFGARITGNLYMPFTGNRILGTTSSDGSYLFTDGALKLNNGGVHNLTNVQSDYIFFEAYVAKPFEIHFFNEPGGGPSGVDLGMYYANGGFFTLDSSTYNPVPEPITFAVLAPALLLLRRKSRVKRS